MAPLESPANSVSISTSLLERVRANDAVAWERVTRLFTPLVYGWVRRAGVLQADAADVVQDVFLEVARSVARFRRENPGDTFAGWLRTITRRRVIDHLRRHHGPEPAGGSEALVRMEQVPDPDPPADDDSDPAGATAELVRRGLELIRGEFEERTWQAFQGTAVDGRPAAEVGAALGMSVGAVYVARSRVTHRLREELDGLV